MGITLFALGFIAKIKEVDPFHGYLFFGSGLVLFIPGFFFLCKICQAYREQDEEERNNILRDIPEMWVKLNQDWFMDEFSVLWE